jgi:hypothetical protein
MFKMTLIFPRKIWMIWTNLMKTTLLFVTLLVLAFGGSGCIFGHHHAAPAGPDQSKAIITPDSSLVAKVVSVNTVARFVVLNFPPDQMPKIGQSLFIYHEGLKVAEVKITGPQQEFNIVADLISGDAKAGDIVRDE